MAEQKKRKGRRAYLNDLYTDVGGNTVYTGRMYRYRGALPWSEARKRLGILGGAAVLCFIAVLCVPAPSMLGIGKAYVVLPLLLQAVAVLLTVWAAVRLFSNGPDLRAYVWEATAKKLPWWLEMTAVFAGVSVAGNLVYLALRGFEGRPVLSLLVIALHAMCAALAVFALRFLRTLRWDGGEELPPKDGE